jgi:hypothetical protein
MALFLAAILAGGSAGALLQTRLGSPVLALVLAHSIVAWSAGCCCWSACRSWRCNYWLPEIRHRGTLWGCAGQ